MLAETLYAVPNERIALTLSHGGMLIIIDLLQNRIPFFNPAYPFLIQTLSSFISQSRIHKNMFCILFVMYDN